MYNKMNKTENLKTILHDMKNELNSILEDKIELDEDDKQDLIHYFKLEVLPLGLDTTDEIYEDILIILGKLGIDREILLEDVNDTVNISCNRD